LPCPSVSPATVYAGEEAKGEHGNAPPVRSTATTAGAAALGLGGALTATQIAGRETWSIDDEHGYADPAAFREALSGLMAAGLCD
jgi:hypothetical protein